LSQRAEPHLDSYQANLHLNNHLLSQDGLLHSESLIGAVLNLIINALQSDARNIHVTLASSDDSGIQISVEDDGKGMPESIRLQAFTPFYTTKAQGTGLGLAVVFAVVKAHGGHVSLESNEGVGTQVCMHLPGRGNSLE
jgi:two-component system sensor histidine kinase FlrB